MDFLLQTSLQKEKIKNLIPLKNPENTKLGVFYYIIVYEKKQSNINRNVGLSFNFIFGGYDFILYFTN